MTTFKIEIDWVSLTTNTYKNPHDYNYYNNYKVGYQKSCTR